MLLSALPGGMLSVRITFELKSEVGWPELVQQVAKVYNALPVRKSPHGHPGGQLRRDWIDRPVRPGLWPAQGHQRLRFVLAVWLWKPASADLDRGGLPADFLANFQDCSSSPRSVCLSTFRTKKRSITGPLTCVTTCASPGRSSGKHSSISGKPARLTTCRPPL